MNSQLFMVFDVESVGLHGDAFAVGYVVVDRGGKEQESGLFCVSPETVMGTAGDFGWVKKHVVGPTFGPISFKPTHAQTFESAAGVRDAFWGRWLSLRENGAVLAADCAWPVEARFLAACVADAPGERNWVGPYPLHEVASVRLAAGLEPLATVDRLPDELPAHNPLADARQSARLLIEALNICAGLPPSP